MRLTSKLLSFLNRVFDKDPEQFLALRLVYDGTMSWRVEDARLYTTVVGGTGANLSIDLTAYTVSGLTTFLALQPGYTVPYVDTTELSQLSARVLIDGAGTPAKSNGDHLYGYTNVLWSWLEAMANELNIAGQQIAEMLRQMSTRTAEDEWLDELGGYYGVPRLAGELDVAYGPRIIAEVLRPRSNNIALEMAISVFTGQDVSVTDAYVFEASSETYNAARTHNSAITYSSTASQKYGLFDVEYGYDIEHGSGDFTEFQEIVRALIERLRAAGTHLRALTLTGSVLSDAAAAPTDGAGDLGLSISVGLDDAPDAPTETMGMGVAFTMDDASSGALDDASLSVISAFYYGGGTVLRHHNGAITYRGTTTSSETL